METIKLENTTEQAYRVNGQVTFMPGEVVEIVKDDLKRLPNIQTLIDRGSLKIVAARGRSKKVAEDDEVIEEA